MSLPPDPPALTSIETADALYERVVHRGRRLRRERRAFLATAALSLMLLAAAVPIALTNDDGAQVATTDRPKDTKPPAPTTTQTTEHEYPPYVETTTTAAPVPVVQGSTVSSPGRRGVAPRPATTVRRAAPTTAPPRPPTTSAPQTTTTTVVPGSAPTSACNGTTPIAPVDHQIAFVRGGDIWVTSAAGGGTPTNLTSSAGVEQAPVWSPDGTRLAFVREGGLYAMPAVQGAVPSRLTDADGAPTWSFDGGRIAFVRDGDIRWVGANGGGDQAAIDVAEPLSSPTWSPDGCQLAFSWQGHVLRGRDDGTGITMVRARATQPSWGSTGRIVFAAVVNGRTEVGIVDRNGDGFQQLTVSGASQPSWSPQGDAVAYRTPPGGEVGIHTRRTDGSASTRITDDTNDTDPAW